MSKVQAVRLNDHNKPNDGNAKQNPSHSAETVKR